MCCKHGNLDANYRYEQKKCPTIYRMCELGKKCMFTHTVESTVCDESPKKKVDDTRGRGTSHTVDSTVYVNIEKSGGLGWTWPADGYPLPPTTLNFVTRLTLVNPYFV